MELLRVLISDDIDPVCINVLNKSGIEVVKNTKLSREELKNEIKNYDALIVRSSTNVDSEILHASVPRLKVVGRAGVGVDNIDCATATALGVLVINTPAGNTISAAEHTCALITSLMRNIPQATASVKNGEWNRKAFMGNELQGKVLGILGLGRIGREVALRMQSYGVTTVGYDPITTTEQAASFNVKKLTLEELWPQVDIITVHTPLIPQTRNLIGNESLAKCKKGVRIINVARGGIVNESDLLEALKSGQCGGAGLDVYINEPPKDIPELLNHPKVICTPHLGASTVEAQIKVAEEVAEGLVALRDGTNVLGAINGRALSQALTPQAKPILHLITQLGKVFGKRFPDVKQVNVVLSLDGIMDSVPSYVESAVVIGLLDGRVNGLNLINALPKSQELGLTVKVSIDNNRVDLKNAVTIGNDSNQTVSGSVLAGTPVLINWDNEKLNNSIAISNNNHIYIINNDKLSTASQSNSLLGLSRGAQISIVSLAQHCSNLAAESQSYINI